MSEPLWVAFIAASAAILASIGAQIIGAIVSHKQETRRLDLEERKLFADTKRVAFTDYLQTRRSFAAAIVNYYVEPRDRPRVGPRDEAEDTALDEFLRRRASEQWYQLEHLKNEISLLAPDVAAAIKGAKDTNPLWGLDRDQKQEGLGGWRSRYDGTTSEIEKAMRKSLGVEVRERAEILARQDAGSTA